MYKNSLHRKTLTVNKHKTVTEHKKEAYIDSTNAAQKYLCFKEILCTFNPFGADIHLTYMSVDLQETITL